MKEARTIEVLKCDCCGVTINQPNSFLNDGSWQETSITVYNKDLCIRCAARLLNEMRNDIDIDLFLDTFEENKGKFRGFSSSGHDGMTLLFDTSSAVDFRKE
jgi:hypothetical protein